MNQSPFGQYSAYYDLIYRDKNYQQEVAEFENILKTHGIILPADVLELGCGTGGHAFVLARRGYLVTAVDRSSEMLKIARNKLSSAAAGIEFVQCEIQSLSLEKRFRAALSMFDVVSYQVEDVLIKDFLRTVGQHLHPGGVFYFDCWNGLAVEELGCQSRIVNFQSLDGRQMIRKANPSVNWQTKRVDVHIELFLKDENAAEELVVSEHHLMRYFFPEELSRFLLAAGFKDVQFHQFQDENSEFSKLNWKLKVSAIKI